MNYRHSRLGGSVAVMLAVALMLLISTPSIAQVVAIELVWCI
jgi:hypothetical protein